MKVTLNTIRNLNKHYDCAEDVTAIGVDKLIKKIETQLAAIEEVIDIGSKYQGIVVAKVISCDKHPDADKLHVCKIDDGRVVKDVERDDNGYVQVVCGALNVREGLFVAWLPPGTTVPDTLGKEPLVLEDREIRGVKSNGMLASAKELGLGDNHEGILEIGGDQKPGSDFAEITGLKDDLVLDMENKMFTHRPDCFGFLGISRELAGIQSLPFKSPPWYVPNPDFPDIEADELKLEVKNELPDLAPRFSTITMRGVSVGPSPLWLQVEFAELGQKLINNIVDYSNFYMIETGQPLHAYDYDKVKALSEGDGATIVIRNPKPGEKIKLLNGKEVEPRAEAIIIATNKQAIGIGGVMGGADTEVDENTQNIILECANFDMYSIRRTSMEHGLFTDAVSRFTKGQSPLQNLAVLSKIVNEIRQFAGGKVASKVIDDNHVSQAVMTRGSVHPSVEVTTDFINSRLGLKLSADEMSKLLTNVECQVEVNGEQLTVTAPFWRTDIELREDVVEEIGRLYGYDKLPMKLPRRDLRPASKDPQLTLKSEVRARLAKAGANEILSYSFVPGSLLDSVGQDRAKAFEISNALSPDLQYYRLSLMPSLLEKVHPNIKSGFKEFALFEIGKTHGTDHGDDDDGLPKEFEFTGLVVAADDKLKKSGAAYYQARTYLEALVGHDSLVFKPLSQDMQAYAVTKPYDLNRSAAVSLKDGEFLGIIGEFRPSVVRALKLPKYSAGFEVDTMALGRIMSKTASYIPLERFPGVKQDITLQVPANMAYDELQDFVSKAYGTNAPDNSLIKLELVDIYQKDDAVGSKNVTFRLTTTGTDRTLTDKEVNRVLDAIAEAAKTELDATRI
jgi:phenylalanyl-tRNA synthetase beta chain